MSDQANLKNGLGFSVLLLVMATLASAATVTVGPGADYDLGTIQAGIDASVEGDTVLVAPGEYVITEPITFRGKAITVKSGSGPDQTTIRMGTPTDTERGTVVVFENSETVASVLDGFTVTGGKGIFIQGVWGGGGILFIASSGTLNNCVIMQNRTKCSQYSNWRLPPRPAPLKDASLCGRRRRRGWSDCLFRVLRNPNELRYKQEFSKHRKWGWDLLCL